MTGIPTWLQAHLEATGRADTDGTTRAIRARNCPHCGAPVIRALDGDLAALPATCQPQPVDTLGEALAVAASCDTYDLIPAAGRLELDHRDHWRITGRRKHPVLAEHRCGVTWPPDPTPPTVHRRPAADHQEVPF